MTIPSYSNFGDVAHGEYAYGTGAADGNLRVLWNNLMALAGDDGSGYGVNGYDCGGGACNFPCGHAIAVYRSTATQRGILPYDDANNPTIGSLTRNGVAFFDQVMSIFHSKTLLYYRTIGAKLWYVDSSGEEASHALEDYNDTIDNDHPTINRYHVLDLGEVDGLEVGTYYEIRAYLGNRNDGPDDPNYNNIIEFAFERDI